jgi:hypothetical protein
MGQQEVLDFLNEEGNKGYWFSSAQIREGLKNKGYTNGVIKGVFDDAFKLVAFNDIEAKQIGFLRNSKIVFRGKQ